MPSADAKAAKVKVEETMEADDNILSSIVQARRKNPTNATSLTSKSRSKDAKTKFEEYDDDDDFETPVKGKSSSVSRSKVANVKKENEDGDDYHKTISKKNSASKANKELSKKKKKKEEEEEEKKGSVVAQQNGKKREKKVYDMPGQKRDPPEERDPIRIFYETLYQQLPNSEMAQMWMMESGLLSKEEAMKVYEKKQKKNQQKLTSPIKALVTTKHTQSATVMKKTPSPSVSSIKKKTNPKVETKQSKKRKTADGSDKEDSDEDFIVSRSSKKQRAS